MQRDLGQRDFEVNQLSVAIESHQQLLPAIDGFSLRLYPGETVALLGESGCGKSMTALALMRLLPENIVYGDKSQIHLDGTELLNLPEKIMRSLRGRKLAMIFQEPMTALNPVLTIEQQLAEVLVREESVNRKILREKMVALLQEVELSKPLLRLRQYPHQLSGGQKQRVIIAMALACHPEILIADEPTTALDVTIQAQILALLKKLQQKHGMSLLFITHDLGVAKAIADRICVMYAGQIVELAEAKSFFTRVYHPYSQQLLASLPSLSKRSHRLSIIKGKVPALDEMPKGCRFHPRCPYVMPQCHSSPPPLEQQADHWVRCLLYPDSQALPPLELQQILLEPIQAEASLAPVLSVRDLQVYFYQKIPGSFMQKDCIKAVDGLSFALYPGKTTALVGESGCGKTTASRAILRLIPATGGEVFFREDNVLTMHRQDLQAYRKKVQIIFQDPFSSMNPRLTIADILSEGLRAQNVPVSLIEKRLHQLLDQVNLPALSLHRYPHQFSGGQRQRLCIARALATSPEILICDEPTSALDVSVQAQILNLLQDLQRELKIAYLFITHNMGVVAYMADEVIVMKDGRIVEQGPCTSILTEPQQPYTQQLLQSVLAV